MQQIILNIKDDLQLVSLLSLWDTLDNWCNDFEIVFVKDLDLFQNKYKTEDCLDVVFFPQFYGFYCNTIFWQSTLEIRERSFKFIK